MNDAPKPESLRERKRRETLHRIAQVGLNAFLTKGYDETTLDEIAVAAGISRRTFFHYFNSKDDVLLAYLGNYASMIKASVLDEPSPAAPIEIARNALLRLVGRFQEPEMMATARLMRESKTLRSRRHAGYLQFEQAIFDGLCELRPGQEQRDSLRLVSLVAIAALRLAVETWQQQTAKRPLAGYIQDAFEKLKTAI